MTNPPLSEGTEVLAELKEQTKWLRFLGLRALGPVLEQQLKSDRERLAYELSDGRASTAIAPAVGVSSRMITNYWTKWIAAGIAEETKNGRATRLASLSQLGIAVPAAATATRGKTPEVALSEGQDEEAAHGESDE